MSWMERSVPEFSIERMIWHCYVHSWDRFYFCHCHSGGNWQLHRSFKKPEQLAAWCGLVPSLYQSAEKTILGGITKQGSKHIRRMLIQVAYAISRTKDSKLKKFFLRIQAKKGSKVAAVALARKVLCILHHLLVNQEIYLEDRDKKIMRKKHLVFDVK